jgi:hypothetical protein
VINLDSEGDSYATENYDWELVALNVSTELFKRLKLNFQILNLKFGRDSGDELCIVSR